MSSISSRGPSSTENDSKVRNNRSGGGGGGSSGPHTQETPPPSPTGSSDRGSKACCFCWCCCCSCSWWVCRFCFIYSCKDHKSQSVLVSVVFFETLIWIVVWNRTRNSFFNYSNVITQVHGHWCWARSLGPSNCLAVSCGTQKYFPSYFPLILRQRDFSAEPTWEENVEGWFQTRQLAFPAICTEPTKLSLWRQQRPLLFPWSASSTSSWD